MTVAGIAIRPAVAGDHAYIAATALHQVPRFVRHVQREDLVLVVRAALNASALVVACSAEDPDTLCGWCAAFGGAPWFTFVARELRGHGIGARLRLEVVNGTRLGTLHDPRDERDSYRRQDANHASTTAWPRDVHGIGMRDPRGIRP